MLWNDHSDNIMFVRRKSLMFFQLRRSFSHVLDYKTDLMKMEPQIVHKQQTSINTTHFMCRQEVKGQNLRDGALNYDWNAKDQQSEISIILKPNI